MNALLPSDEAERLKVLAGYRILDTEAERNFDDITLLASQVCRTPIALISLVDENRQWFKSKIGMIESETSRDIAFCAHGILEPDLFEVEDALADERFAANPLVTRNPKIRFYAGSPLITPDGHALGMLCVIDQVPRELSPSEKAALKALSRQVVAQLELRRNIAERKQSEDALRQSEERFRNYFELGLIGMAITSPVKGCIEVNDEICRILGYERSELLRMTWAELTHPDDLAADIADFNRVQAGEIDGYSMEKRFIRKDGQAIDATISVKCLRRTDGSVDYFVALLQDITERKRAEEQLRKIGAQLADAQRLAHIGSWEWDLTTDTVAWSDEKYRIMGWEPQEVPASYTAFIESVHPDDRTRMHEAIQQARRDHKPFSYQYRVLLPTGEVRVRHGEGSVCTNEMGRATRMFGTTQDITERKLADERLREYEKVVEGAEEMIAVIDRNYRYLLANRAFLKYRGLEREQVVGRSVAEVLNEGVFENVVKEKLDECLEGKPIQYEMSYRYPDRGERDLLVSYFPIEGPAGVDRCACVLQDITERKIAKAALRDSEERFRELAENINEVFFVWDATDGASRLLYVSPAYATIWGRSCESLYSSHQSWKDALHPDDKKWVLAELSGSDLEQINDLTYRIVRPDQSVRWIRDRIFPVHDEKGVVVRLAEITVDITENKLAEEELRQVNEQLRVLSRRLFQVQDDERRHLARELHDEIGQALTAAKINVDSIESAEGSTQSLRLKETSTLLDNLLRQVRQISLDLHSSLLDDLGLVPALRSLLDQQARRAGLRAQFFAPEPLENIDPEIQTTGFRIAQEAITNVLRHAKAQSVDVHLQTEAGQLRMKIVDDGSGFDLTEVERHAHQGASFGLMGMRERAALVGGRVQIISSPNKGTTVQVSLPLHASDERPRSATP